MQISSADAQEPRAFARTFFRDFFRRVFRFLSSVKLAVPLLAILIAVLAGGTMVESAQGSEAAKILIYDTPWFAAFLVLLAANVLFAALSRRPWKKKHTGFVLTHCGILIILAGSFVTRYSMIDAQMVIAEGQTESSVALPESMLYLIPVHGGAEIPFRVPRKALVWKGRERLEPESPQEKVLPELYLTAYYPKARPVQSIAAADSGPAALQVTLHNNFVNETQWLLEEPADRSALQLGPAQLVLSRTLLQDSAAEAPPAATLEFSADGKSSFVMPLPEPFKENETFVLKDTAYRITLVKAFKDAVVAGRVLMERPAGDVPDPALPPNAAIQLVLEGKGIREEHTVFAQFPDFSTLHGKKGSETGYRILYHVPEGAQRGGHMLRLIPGPEGRIQYQIKTGGVLQNGETREGQEFDTGWMGMKLRVEKYNEHARLETLFQPQPNISNARDVTPALEVEIAQGGESRRLHLRQGIAEALVLGGSHYQAVFAQKVLPVGFSLELKDFKIKHNPGTRQPASFSSDVVLHDVSRGVERKQTISMNQPLEYQGFKIYQSGYVQEEGVPETSIFSVARDPGIGIKYAGAVVMIIGITVMFSMRRLYKPEKKT